MISQHHDDDQDDSRSGIASEHARSRNQTGTERLEAVDVVPAMAADSHGKGPSLRP